MKPLTIQDVQAIQHQRSVEVYHITPEQQWSSLEIAGSMCGEAGEAANYAKKLRRLDQNIVGNKEKKDRNALVLGLSLELADAFLYMCSLATKEGIDLAEAIAYKFNLTSEDIQAPHRIE